MTRILICILILGFIDSSNTLKAQKFSFNDTSKVSFKANLVFQYGGESKLTIFPKLNMVRIHQSKILKPYYGLELGFHPLFVAGAFTFAGVTGVELNSFNLESSLCHFRTTKVNDGNGEYSGPFIQNSFNLKLGYSIKKFTLKVGMSFLIDKSIPEGDERIPLIDFGKINNHIFGLELQFRIN